MQSRNGKQANVAAVFCDTGVVGFILTVGNMLLMQGLTMMLYKDKYRKCSMQNQGLAQGFNVRAM